MPVRNAEAFLNSCLDSIIEQDYTHWELIVVNDYSTDNTPRILDQYTANDTRIKYFNNSKTPGIIPSLQLASSKCQGQFITRMDADDLMSKDKLRLLHSRLIKQGKGHIAVGLVSYFSESNLGEGYKKYADWLNKLVLNESCFEDIYKECVIPSPNWMMFIEEFQFIGGFNEYVYPEDYDFCFRLRAHNLKVSGVDSITHQWRDHQSRASRNDPNYLDNRFIDFKCQKFIEYDYKNDYPLVLWGAGKKAKAVASKLTEKYIPIVWITNNSKKIGHNIYNIPIKDVSILQDLEYYYCINLVAQPQSKKEILEFLANDKSCVEYYSFC